MTIKEKLRLVRELESDIEYEALKMVEDKLKYGPLVHVVGTAWDCPKSSIGLCVYNHIEDHAHDQCVFCGHPEERK